MIVLSIMGNAGANYAPVTIKAVETRALDGPAHHGLLVTTGGITDPNLSAYEVQFRPDTAFSAPPWAVYSTTIKPFDASWIAVPYRNDKMGLNATTKYCVRIRAIYTASVTPWAEQCGWQLTGANTSGEDTDGDGLSDAKEYALGLDPNNADTDSDGMPDGIEIANTTNPNKPLYGKIQIETTAIDFGNGNPAGSFPNQHRYLALTNVGDQPAVITGVKVSLPIFHIGAAPAILSHIPPHNVARIPISFLPTARGTFTGSISVAVAYQSDLKPIPVTGTGIQIPDCQVSPLALDFGVVHAGDQAVMTREIVVANQPAGGALAPNIDTPFGFTIHSDHLGIAPGLRGITLPVGRALQIPIFFQHLTPGIYDTTMHVRSFYCGEQMVQIKATAD